MDNLTLRKNRVRAKIGGTAERPRLSVYISNRQVIAQLIDDLNGNTIAYATSKGQDGNLTAKATYVGGVIADKAKEAGIESVVFDRNGRRYAGRLHALASAAREKGLKF